MIRRESEGLLDLFILMHVWYNRLESEDQKRGFREALRALDHATGQAADRGGNPFWAAALLTASLHDFKPYEKGPTLLSVGEELAAVQETFYKAVEYSAALRKERGE